MRWVTKSHLHLDRVATPWLIARFVDPAAEFVFVDWDLQVAAEGDAIPFGVPDVELSSHDAGGTAFRKVVARYGLDDPALALMERLVASGVADALGSAPPPGQTEEEAMLGAALNRLGAGFGIAFDDDEHLRAGMALYEAVYALCQVKALEAAVLREAPERLPARVSYLRRATGRAA
jgi:hypothetical protein